jgi:hypothetical protein
MKTVRAWHVLILVWVALDLGTPHVPGVFSVQHGDFFMDGVMRALAGDAPGKCVRDAPRASITGLDGSACAPATARAVARDARRPYDRQHPRHPLHAAAVLGPLDAEDH